MNHRHPAWLVTALLFGFAAVWFAALGYGAQGAQDRGHANVKSETSDVHAEMSKASKVLLSLKKGESVTVKLDMRISAGCWSHIKVAAPTEASGYVPCSDLERAPQREEQFLILPSAEAATTDWSKTPLADKIRKLCPEIDEGQLKYGWPLPQVASSIAMDRCFEISGGAPGMKLTADEIRVWQSKAEQSGAQACWDRYLAVREKHRALERDAGAADRSLAALREWEHDPCHWRVKALRDAIVLRPYMKDLPRVYDEIMSGRQPTIP
jgi:hypothetical protein